MRPCIMLKQFKSAKQKLMYFCSHFPGFTKTINETTELQNCKPLPGQFLAAIRFIRCTKH